MAKKAKKATKTSSKGTKRAKHTKTAKTVALRRTVAKKVKTVGSGLSRTPRLTTPSGKFVYLFGKKTDGNGTMKPLLGGKGANLAEMCRIGLPEPPGFTITTDVCTYYYANGRKYPAALKAQMETGVASIEQQTKKKFGDLTNPLLVSVRSGARDSMPG